MHNPSKLLTRPERIALNRRIAKVKHAFLQECLPNGRISSYGGYYEAMVGVPSEHIYYTPPGGSGHFRSTKPTPDCPERHRRLVTEPLKIRVSLAKGGHWWGDENHRNPKKDWVWLWCPELPRLPGLSGTGLPGPDQRTKSMAKRAGSPSSPGTRTRTA